MPVFGLAAHAYCAALLPEYKRLGPVYEPLAVALFALVAPLVGLMGGGRRRGWAQGQRGFVVLLGAKSGGWLFVMFACLAVGVPYLLALSLGAVGYSELILLVAICFYGVGLAVGLGIFLVLLNLRILTLRGNQATIIELLGAPLKVLEISAAPERKLIAVVDFGPPQSLWLSAPLISVPDSELEAQLLSIVTAVKLTLASNGTGRFP